MDADTLAAIQALSGRIAVLEAAATTNAAQQNAAAIAMAQATASAQEQAIIAQQAHDAAWAAWHTGNPMPGWQPGMPINPGWQHHL